MRLRAASAIAEAARDIRRVGARSWRAKPGAMVQLVVARRLSIEGPSGALCGARAELERGEVRDRLAAILLSLSALAAANAIDSRANPTSTAVDGTTVIDETDRAAGTGADAFGLLAHPPRQLCHRARDDALAKQLWVRARRGAGRRAPAI
jgi:hypothetical protein